MSVTEAAAELEAAAGFDAAGRHDEAVNALSIAAARGDIESLTQLGKRLIVGDRAPAMPKEGVGLLIDALNRGGAEAAVRLAALAALGAHTRQSWADGLNLLAIAAERGSGFARGQLGLLCPDPTLQVEAASAVLGQAPKGWWRRVAASIEPFAWTDVGPAEALHASPDVRAFRDFASGPVCHWLIERARGKLKRALVYDASVRHDIADGSRTNSVAEFDLVDTDLVQVALQLRMAAACGLPPAHMEAPAVLHYGVGQEIANHYDFLDPNTPNREHEIATKGERAITFLVYLNDEYDGGETDFPRLGVRHKGVRGEGLYFVNALPTGEPDTRMLHAGMPPTRGEKWIVSQFVRNRSALPTALR